MLIECNFNRYPAALQYLKYSLDHCLDQSGKTMKDTQAALAKCHLIIGNWNLAGTLLQYYQSRSTYTYLKKQLYFCDRGGSGKSAEIGPPLCQGCLHQG